MSAGWGWGVVCAGVALCSASAVKADDGYVTGVGGAVHLMKGHPTIRMVSEEVHIQLPEGKVSASFIFKNEGAATTVEIGFPETGKDVFPQPRSHMVGFHSTVDGQPVKVTRRVATKPTLENDYDYDYWWVKKVSFGRGQTRTIVNRYQGGVDFFSTSIHQSGFNYVLKTGASWHGTIGRAKIVCDLGSVADCGPLRFSPAGGRRKGRTITWDLRNLKPKEDVSIDWYQGFSDVAINGRWLWKQSENGFPHRDWGNSEEPTPFKRGTEVWVPVRLAAEWLNADLEGDPARGAVTLTRNDRRMVCTVGSATLKTEHHAMPLPGNVFKKQGAIFIPLRALVKALGGETHYNASGRLLVTVPESKQISQR
jgi:hypothetical protein